MNKYIIEFLGTFFLILIIGMTGNPIAIGFGLAVLVYMGAHISGAHYNPVVSLAMMINNQINFRNFLLYVLSQLLGSIAATFTIMKISKESFIVISKTSDNISFYTAEILFTFLLVFVILNVALSKNLKGNQFYGLAIGLTVLAGAFAVGDISGAVFNPAVSFGPSFFSFFEYIFTDFLSELPISDQIIAEFNLSKKDLYSHDFFSRYLISTIIGSFIASFLYKKLYS